MNCLKGVVLLLFLNPYFIKTEEEGLEIKAKQDDEGSLDIFQTISDIQSRYHLNIWVKGNHDSEELGWYLLGRFIISSYDLFDIGNDENNTNDQLDLLDKLLTEDSTLFTFKLCDRNDLLRSNCPEITINRETVKLLFQPTCSLTIHCGYKTQPYALSVACTRKYENRTIWDLFNFSSAVAKVKAPRRLVKLFIPSKAAAVPVFQSEHTFKLPLKEDPVIIKSLIPNSIYSFGFFAVCLYLAKSYLGL